MRIESVMCITEKLDYSSVEHENLVCRHRVKSIDETEYTKYKSGSSNQYDRQIYIYIYHNDSVKAAGSTFISPGYFRNRARELALRLARPAKHTTASIHLSEWPADTNDRMESDSPWRLIDW